jgi:outer membrane protein assembly factor BamA
MLQVDVKIERGTRGNDGAVPVAFRVVEGDMFRIGKLRVSVPSDMMMEKELASKLTVKPGEVFSRTKMIAAIDRIRATFANGNTVSVAPETQLDPKKRVVDVTIVVTP